MHNIEEALEVLVAKNITKVFDEALGGEVVKVLDNLNLTINAGETVGIVGNSGCGKTTLLNILSLVEEPTSGFLYIGGQDIKNLQRDELMAKDIGIVYQFHHLIPELSALENVTVALLISGFSHREAVKMAQEALKFLDLETKFDRLPRELSGGERQRVAIARAIVKSPKIIFADEPTGSLDEEAGNIVFNLLLDCAKQNNCALVCVTHNLELAKRLDKIYTIKNGRLS